MNIDELLNKYFEGETSCEEEQQLRTFFASENVPQHLAIYKPMFAYIDEEITKNQQKKIKSPVNTRKIFYYISGIAAALILMIGIRQFILPADPCLCSGNYVVINGRCYTDMSKVRQLAFEALQEVATPVNEYFPEKDIEALDHEIIENQLKELSDFFSDDE